MLARKNYVRALKRSLASAKVMLNPRSTDAAIAAANPDAFFFPARLFVAFVIAILGTSTLCVLAINAVLSFRTSIIVADTAAAKAVFSGVSSLQALFLSKTQLELFDREIDWAYQQVAMHTVDHGIEGISRY
jgi:hypothetical protein